MSRVTPCEVQELVPTKLEQDQIQIWIDSASTIVSSTCADLTTAVQTQVELFLAAHFVAMLDAKLKGFVTKEKFDVFEKTYVNPVTYKNSIDGTTYGTTANMLSGGRLANANLSKASVTFL